MGPIWGRQDPGGPHELCYLGYFRKRFNFKNCDSMIFSTSCSPLPCGPAVAAVWRWDLRRWVVVAGSRLPSVWPSPPTPEGSSADGSIAPRLSPNASCKATNTHIWTLVLNLFYQRWKWKSFLEYKMGNVVEFLPQRGQGPVDTT